MLFFSVFGQILIIFILRILSEDSEPDSPPTLEHLETLPSFHPSPPVSIHHPAIHHSTHSSSHPQAMSLQPVTAPPVLNTDMSLQTEDLLLAVSSSADPTLGSNQRAGKRPPVCSSSTSPGQGIDSKGLKNKVFSLLSSYDGEHCLKYFVVQMLRKKNTFKINPQHNPIY